jgi:Protein of unknown function (DUF998)
VIQHNWSQLTRLHRRPALWLAWAAAILYSSWPLGYVLNPVVGRHDLASQLEARHEPFNWVFIGMDIATGLAITIVGMWQMNAGGKRALLKWCALSYVAFGALVALAAAMPLNCNPETRGACGPLLRNPVLLVHGLSSILSVLFLLFSTIALGASVYQRRGRGPAYRLFVATLAGWLAFGIGYFVEVLAHNSSNLLQYYFITVCSVSIVLVIGAIEYLHLLDERRQLTESPAEVL